LKYGLRNSPPLYPAGQHLEGAVLALSRERVRRAVAKASDEFSVCLLDCFFALRGDRGARSGPELILE